MLIFSLERMEMIEKFETGSSYNQRNMLLRLVEMGYKRNDSFFSGKRPVGRQFLQGQLLGLDSGDDDVEIRCAVFYRALFRGRKRI